MAVVAARAQSNPGQEWAGYVPSWPLDQSLADEFDDNGTYKSTNEIIEELPRIFRDKAVQIQHEYDRYGINKLVDALDYWLGNGDTPPTLHWNKLMDHPRFAKSVDKLLALLWVLFVLAYCQRSQKRRAIKRFLLKHFNKMVLPVGIMGAAFYLPLLIWMPSQLYYLSLPSYEQLKAEFLSGGSIPLLMAVLFIWLLAGVIYCSWQMFKHRKRRSGARLLRIMLAGTLTFPPVLVFFWR